MRGDIALFFGLVAVIGGIVVAAAFIFLVGGNGNNACDSPLVPLGGGEADVSQLGFQTEDVGLTKVIQAATAGRLEDAESAFFGDVHNFTHNVDPAIREEDEDLAKDLCRTVIELEEELALDQRVAIIASHATKLRELLRDGAEALGFAAPGR